MNHDHPSPRSSPSPPPPPSLSAHAPTSATPTPTTTTTTRIGSLSPSPSPQRDIKPSKLEDRQSKGRNRHAPYQTDALNQVFARTDHPTLQERTSLAKRLGMETKVVNSWFQNKRATLKKRAIREAAQPTSAPPSERIEDSPPPPAYPSSSSSLSVAAANGSQYGVIQPSPLKHAGSSGGSVTAHVLPPRNRPHPSLPPPPMEYAAHAYHSRHPLDVSTTGTLPSLPPISSLLLRPPHPPASPESESDVDDAASSARSVHLAPIYDRMRPSAAPPHVIAYDRFHGAPRHHAYPSYYHLPHDVQPHRRRASVSPVPSHDDGRAGWYASSQASSRSRSPPTHARYRTYPEGVVHGWSEPEYEPASDPESDHVAAAAVAAATVAAAEAAAAHAGKRKRGGVSTGTAPAKTRQRLNARQVKELRDFYSHTTHPSRMEQEQLAEEIGLRVHSVTIWFQNQRSMDKRRRALGGATGSSDAIPAPPSRVSSASDRPSPPPSSFASTAVGTPLLHPPTSATRRGGNGSSARPRRSRPEPAQLEALKRLYAQTTTPSIDQRARLAGEIGMETSKVTNWFRNLRQTAKKKRSVGAVAGAEGGMDVDDAEDEGMSDEDDEDEEDEEEESAPPSRAYTPEEDEEELGAGEPLPLKRRRLSDEGADADVRMGEATLHESDEEEEEVVTPPPSSVGRHPRHGQHHHHHHHHHHARTATTVAAAPSPALVPRTFGYEGRVQGKDVVADPIAMRTNVAVEDAVLLLSLRGQA